MWAIERFALRDQANVIAELEVARAATKGKSRALKRRGLEERKRLRSLLVEHGISYRLPPSQHPMLVALIRELWATLPFAGVLPKVRSVKSERARQRTIADLLSAAIPGWVGDWQTVRNILKPPKPPRKRKPRRSAAVPLRRRST